MAPTAMKTVPSGRFETCRYGALAVGGTEGATILKAPARVGRPVGRAPPFAAEEPPVMVGTAPIADPADPPVMVTPEGCVVAPVCAAGGAGLPVADPVSDADPVFGAVFAESGVLGCVAAALGCAAALDCAAAALERLGRLGGCEGSAADAVITSSETATAVESSGVLPESLMMSVITADGLKKCVCTTKTRWGCCRDSARAEFLDRMIVVHNNLKERLFDGGMKRRPRLMALTLFPLPKLVQTLSFVVPQIDLSCTNSEACFSTRSNKGLY
jgi:hypothetical protein